MNKRSKHEKQNFEMNREIFLGKDKGTDNLEERIDKSDY